MEQVMPAFGITGRMPRERVESFREHNQAAYEAQRRGRRGPTPEVFFAKHIDNSRIVKADNPQCRREIRSFTIATCILFFLVMTYVWQHFSAIEMGYSIEAQKLKVEHLREDNRQLLLTESQLVDPNRIDQIAKQLGMDAPQPGQVVRPDGSFVTGEPVLAEAKTPSAMLP